jgi:hypothetical protein
MRKFVLAASIGVLVAAVGGVAYAAQAAGTPKAAAASAVTERSLSATGKIVSFDDTTRTLTLATTEGQQNFMVGSKARVQQGAKTLTAGSLSSMAGRRAKVRYTASSGDRAAESVMVSGNVRVKSASPAPR